MPHPSHLYLDPAAAPLLTQAIALAGRQGAVADALWVFPGLRGARRSKELLALQGAWLAPRMTTLGALPEWLRADALPLATEFTAMLARAAAARKAGEGLLAAFPKPPETADVAGWLALGRQIGRLADDLGEANLSFAEVAQTQMEPAKWQALAQVEADALAQVRAWGQNEKNAARRQRADASAADLRQIRWIVLVACLDLPRPAQEALEQWIAGGGQVLILTPALPERQSAQWFDGWGRPVAAAWNDDACRIRLPQEPVFPADSAAEAHAAAQAVRAWLADAPHLSPDDFSVGLAVETEAPLLKVMLENAGLPVRHGPGRPVSGSQPVSALRALGAYLRLRDAGDATRKPEALCEALRDPVLARVCAAAMGGEAQLAPLLEKIKALPIRKEETKEQWRRCDAALLQLAGGEKTLAAWGAHWRAALAAWFPPSDAGPAAFGPQRGLEKAMELLGGALGEMAAAPEVLGQVPAHTAIDAALAALEGQGIPEEGGEAAIELLGPLEWLLDDAPHLVLSGLNGEHIPRPPRPHPFLPDGLRRKLGLSCDATRLARDLASFEAVLASRKTALLAPRTGQDGAPLTPSRLLLRCDDDALASRLKNFFLKEGGVAQVAPAVGSAAGARDNFLPMVPPRDAPGLTQLSVTAFKSYLSCPYRFWLKHTLALREAAEVSRELSPQDFGSYLHQVLADFGVSRLKDSDDPFAIEAFLLKNLQARFARDFGDDPRVALRLQKPMMEARLRAFAKAQAVLAPDWEIEAVEVKKEGVAFVDGFTLQGRIDRIDRHRHTQELRILDYKTSDKASAPHAKHLQGEEWIDLQLPLYTVLCGDATAQVGYFNLAKDGADLALWSEKAKGTVAQGVERAKAIAETLRLGGRAAFWPPKDPPTYDDGLKALCMDGAEDRAARFARAAQAGGAR